MQQDIGKNVLTVDETTKIIQYLKNGNVLAIAAGFVYDVIADDHPVIDSLSMMTDGVYVWGCDFPYYIEKYQLYISTEFVNFVKGRLW